MATQELEKLGASVDEAQHAIVSMLTSALELKPTLT